LARGACRPALPCQAAVSADYGARLLAFISSKGGYLSRTVALAA
jgi:hypothetical protein